MLEFNLRYLAFVLVYFLNFTSSYAQGDWSVSATVGNNYPNYWAAGIHYPEMTRTFGVEVDYGFSYNQRVAIGYSSTGISEFITYGVSHRLLDQGDSFQAEAGTYTARYHDFYLSFVNELKSNDHFAFHLSPGFYTSFLRDVDATTLYYNGDVGSTHYYNNFSYGLQLDLNLDWKFHKRWAAMLRPRARFSISHINYYTDNTQISVIPLIGIRYKY